MIVTLDELKYIEACIQVADGEGEHAEELMIDQQDLQRRLTEAINESQGFPTRLEVKD